MIQDSFNSDSTFVETASTSTPIFGIVPTPRVQRMAELATDVLRDLYASDAKVTRQVIYERCRVVVADLPRSAKINVHDTTALACMMADL